MKHLAARSGVLWEWIKKLNLIFLLNRRIISIQQWNSMTKKRFSISAILYDKRGNVLSVGNNSYVKTHPLQAEYARRAGEPKKVFLHAEIHAITRCRDLSKAHTLRVFRYAEDGSPADAKPCKICQQAISKANIKFVEYTTNEQNV